jgi:hypothetical protein
LHASSRKMKKPGRERERERDREREKEREYRGSVRCQRKSKKSVHRGVRKLFPEAEIR